MWITWLAYKLQYHNRGSLGGVVVSVLDTGPKVYEFEPSQGSGFLRAIKIRSTGSKAAESHVLRFYGIWKNSWSFMGMFRLNSLFFAHLLFPQSSLVVKLGVSLSRFRLIARSHLLSSGDSTTGPRLQCWDGNLTPSQLPIYHSTTLPLAEFKKWFSQCMVLTLEVSFRFMLQKNFTLHPT
jgi:hypothetical protein